MNKAGALRFCIIGGDSAIGVALEASLRERGVTVQSSSRRATLDRRCHFYLDLRDDPGTFNLPSCDIVILAAAMTRLSECRGDSRLARQVNVDAQIRLAEGALRQGAFVIFLSTNQVFDGSTAMVRPSCPKSPRSVYGIMKAAAEESLLRLGGDAAILRLGKVIGTHLKLFQCWRNDLVEGRPIEAFDDLMFSPIAISNVVLAIERIGTLRAGGVWHFCNHEEINYLEAARHLASQLGVSERLALPMSARIRGIPAEERPSHTSLDSQATKSKTGIAIGDARAELDIGLGFSDRLTQDSNAPMPSSGSDEIDFLRLGR